MTSSGSTRAAGRPDRLERQMIEGAIRRAIADGLSDSKTAVAAGVAPRTVWAYRKKHGIPPAMSTGRRPTAHEEHPIHDGSGALLVSRTFLPPISTPQCCAKCRRGSKAFGVLPCGYNFTCPCHTKETP